MDYFQKMVLRTLMVIVRLLSYIVEIASNLIPGGKDYGKDIRDSIDDLEKK